MVQVENNNAFSVGDKVWWFDEYGILNTGTISSICNSTTDGLPFASITMSYSSTPANGTKLINCWPTKETCIEAEKQRSAAQRAEFKRDIETVEDLVIFLFKHDVCSSTRDTDACAAAAERAHELLGITGTFPFAGIHRRPDLSNY